MKILVFNWRDITHPDAGGAETHIHEITSRWVRCGHSVTLFCGAYPGCKTEDIIDGIKIIRRGNRFTVYLCAFWEYITILRKKNFDLVIDDVNGVPFFTPLYVKVPRITIMHHLVKKIFFRELKFPFSLVGYAFENFFMPFFYRKERFVAVSQSSKEELEKYNLKDVSVIYNGINQNKDQDIKKSENPTVCYVGRIKKYKRLGMLLDIFSEIAVPGLELYIAGEGDALPDLKRQAQEKGMKNIIFLGRVSESEKSEILGKSWIFVTTSEKEGWGITIIESNSFKTPAVGFNVPGVKDAISDGKTGFLVENPKQLKEKLELLLNNKEIREKMSEQALKWSRNFDWDKSATMFLELMKRL